MGGIFLQIKIVTKIVGLPGFSLLVNIMSGFAAGYAEGSDTHRVVANKSTDSSSDRRADDWFSKAGEESKLTKQSPADRKMRLPRILTDMNFCLVIMATITIWIREMPAGY